MKDELHLLRWALGVGEIWTIELEEEDFIPVESSAGGARIETFPSQVTGTIGVDDYTLERVESVQELLNLAPSRVSSVDTLSGVSDYLVWESSDPSSFSPPPVPSRLTVTVSGSTLYNKRSRFRDRLFSGFSGLILIGTDENGTSIEEVVEVLDDGSFTTRNIWKSLEDVEYEGFNGDVAIQWSRAGLDKHRDIYNVAIFDDFEGPLDLSLRTENIGGTDYSFLTFSSARLQLGSDYRDGTGSDYINEETLSEIVLLDTNDQPYVAVDVALNHRNTLVYVLDDQGMVHVYEHNPSAFSPPSLPSTKDVAVGARPLQHYVSLGKTEKVFTWFAMLRHPVLSVEIKRIAPDDSVAYLQGDKTWGATTYLHSKNPLASTPEGSWQDFSFETEYDQLGQWEYYVTTLIASGEVTTGYTGVIVDSVSALSDIETSVSNATTLSFSKEEYWQVGDGSDVYRFKEHRDLYIGDSLNQRLLLREEYDSVEVSY